MSQESPRLESKIGYQLKHLQSLLRAHMDDVLRPLELSIPGYSPLSVESLLVGDPAASACLPDAGTQNT